jgi:hypothetical protein
VNPAKLEKFFYVQYDARTMGLRHVLDDAIQRSPFWHHLSEAGRRVGVVVERRISHVWFSRRAEQSQAEGPSRPARRSPHRRGLLSRARRSILKA